jgi:hypothetical protein
MTGNGLTGRGKEKRKDRDCLPKRWLGLMPRMTKGVLYTRL